MGVSWTIGLVCTVLKFEMVTRMYQYGFCYVHMSYMCF
jgi:hypothetical protein